MRSETKAFLSAVAAVAIVVSLVLVSRCDPWTVGQGDTPAQTTQVTKIEVPPPALENRHWRLFESEKPETRVGVYRGGDEEMRDFKCYIPDGRQLIGKDNLDHSGVSGDVYQNGIIIGKFRFDQTMQSSDSRYGSYLSGHIMGRSADIKLY